MIHLHIDCFSGISGDMFLGALVDAGLSMSQLKQGLHHLNTGGYTLKKKKVIRGTIQATKVDVAVAKGFAKPLSLSILSRLLTKSHLPSVVKTRSLQAFHYLAEAEGSVHGVPFSKVHFHEVGVIDSLVDIVGVFWGITSLGVGTISASPVNVGSGTLISDHGILPVPGPAVAALATDIPIFSKGPARELTTPTGIGILKVLTHHFDGLPPLTPSRIGYGAGSANPKAWPNVLRLFLSHKASANPPEHDLERIVQLQTNVDDLNPQAYEYVMDRLFAAGAIDVTLTPVIMKRGRPGIILTVLAFHGAIDPLMQVMFQETTTLGIRCQEVTRRILRRTIHTIPFQGERIRVKVAMLDKERTKLIPEYQDCRTLAEKTGQPVREIMAQVLEKVRRLNFGQSPGGKPPRRHER